MPADESEVSGERQSMKGPSFFALPFLPMELVMYFGNDCIASHPLDSEMISKPGYISALKRRLLKENEEVLRYADNEPDFLILNFAFSEANTSSANPDRYRPFHSPPDRLR